MLGLNALAPFLSLLLVGQDVQQTVTSNTPPPGEDPLFTAQDMLALEIVGPIEEIRDDRAEEPEYRDATIRWTVGSDTGELPARIRARGNFRKKKSTCRMPPLRVNFAKKEVVGTLFDGQDKLKLVTHCRDGEDYEQNVLEEYLAYRLYNHLTDQSFRVRLAKITYTDPEEDEPLVRFGFFIEDEDRMAARLSGEMQEFTQVHPFRFVEGAEPRVAIFQYMIGNTDFSSVSGHNVKVLRGPDGLIPVPYDFDWAGLVSAKYAKPNEQLGIRNVRQRVFRGFCRADQDFSAAFAEFLDLREALPSIIEEISAGWKEKDRKRAQEYIDDFYEILEDPSKADRRIVRECREVVS